VVAALERSSPAIRKRCRRARIIVRGDCGFCREEIMAWCESHDVYYCLGLGRTPVLTERLPPGLAKAQARWCLSGAASVREFADSIPDGRELEPASPRDWQGRSDAQGPNHALSWTNLPAAGFQGDEDKLVSRRPGSTKNCTARAGRWKTCSSSTNAGFCGPTG